MKLKYIIMMTALTAVSSLAVSGLAAGAAQAEGPKWIHNGNKTFLAAGQKLTVGSKNIGNFTLKGPINVVCKKESNTGELLGGEPGTDKATITFTECSEEGKTVTECAATTSGKTRGEVGPFNVWTVLTYPKGHYKGIEEALDAFIPAGGTTNNTFVTFTMEGTGCSFGVNGAKVTVEANGSPITKPNFGEAGFTKKCGVLAQVGKIEGGVFKLTKSGEEATAGGLNFPATAIAEAELETSSTTHETIKCELFVKSTLSGKGTEVGVSEVKTSPEEEFGWEV